MAVFRVLYELILIRARVRTWSQNKPDELKDVIQINMESIYVIIKMKTLLNSSNFDEAPADEIGLCRMWSHSVPHSDWKENNQLHEAVKRNNRINRTTHGIKFVIRVEMFSLRTALNQMKHIYLSDVRTLSISNHQISHEVERQFLEKFYFILMFLLFTVHVRRFVFFRLIN